jgi:hypothetical protein
MFAKNAAYIFFEGNHRRPFLVSARGIDVSGKCDPEKSGFLDGDVIRSGSTQSTWAESRSLRRVETIRDCQNGISSRVDNFATYTWSGMILFSIMRHTYNLT